MRPVAVHQFFIKYIAIKLELDSACSVVHAVLHRLDAVDQALERLPTAMFHALYELLENCQLFSPKGQAMRNWPAMTKGNVVDGTPTLRFHEKLKSIREVYAVWNPPATSAQMAEVDEQGIAVRTTVESSSNFTMVW